MADEHTMLDSAMPDERSPRRRETLAAWQQVVGEATIRDDRALAGACWRLPAARGAERLRGTACMALRRCRGRWRMYVDFSDDK